MTRLCFATWEFARQLHIAHYAAKSKASGFRRPLACVSEPAHPNYTRNVRTSISRRSRKSLTRFSHCRCYLLSSFMLSKRIWRISRRRRFYNVLAKTVQFCINRDVFSQWSSDHTSASKKMWQPWSRNQFTSRFASCQTPQRYSRLTTHERRTFLR